MATRIREETPADADAIHAVTAAAFRDAPHSDQSEPAIVAALRRAGDLTLSRVAERDGVIVGHVAVSAVTITDGAAGWYGLGPVSVLPEHQGRGIGTRLIQSALADLEADGAAGCVVLGEPDYYGRFGFEPVEGLVFPGAPAAYFQALSFEGSLPQGEVRYADAFYGQ